MRHHPAAPADLWLRPMRHNLGGGSGGTPQTVTNISDPWKGQQPYLQAGFEQAASLFDQPGPGYYPNSTVTPFANETEQSLGMQTQRATAGSPLLRQGQGEVSKTLSGDYLNAGNPYIQRLTDSISNSVIPQVESRFNASGRFGSDASRGVMTKAITDSLAPQLFGAYENERGRMGQAAASAPGMAQADYADADRLAGVGARREDLGSRQIQDSVNRFDYEQQLPYRKLADFMGMIRGNYGGQSTQTTPTQTNPLASIVGGGISAAALAKMLGAI